MSEALARPSLLDEPFVFVDLETTGSSAAEHRITEIGLVEVSGGEVATWSTLIDPQQSIPPFIQQLTGITPAMVRGQPKFAEIAPELFARLEGKLLIAHNVGFDYGFLRAEFERAGYAFTPDRLCTVRLSRALFPGESRHGLDALIARHALVPMARHRALADADLIWQFWRRLDRLLPIDEVRAQIERTVRRHRFSDALDETALEAAPGGCGVYALFGEDDTPLYVGRSVRVRQRLRALLMGERRSARELRITEHARRVEWRETGGEFGAMLSEAQWIATLAPRFNRVAAPRKQQDSAPWPYAGAIALPEPDRPGIVHVVDNWHYLGMANGRAEAEALSARTPDAPSPCFEPGTYRIVQAYLGRGHEPLQLAAHGGVAGERTE